MEVSEVIGLPTPNPSHAHELVLKPVVFGETPLVLKPPIWVWVKISSPSRR